MLRGLLRAENYRNTVYNANLFLAFTAAPGLAWQSTHTTLISWNWWQINGTNYTWAPRAHNGIKVSGTRRTGQWWNMPLLQAMLNIETSLWRTLSYHENHPTAHPETHSSMKKIRGEVLYSLSDLLQERTKSPVPLWTGKPCPYRKTAVLWASTTLAPWATLLICHLSFQCCPDGDADGEDPKIWQVVSADCFALVFGHWKAAPNNKNLWASPGILLSALPREWSVLAVGDTVPGQEAAWLFHCSHRVCATQPQQLPAVPPSEGSGL